MRSFAQSRVGLPTLTGGKKYYSQIESVVCVFPRLMPGSRTPDDGKVHVRGYLEFLDFVTTVERTPGWTRDDWVAFAIDLSLMHQVDPEAEAIDSTPNSPVIVDDYCRRFREFYQNGLRPLVPSRRARRRNEAVRSHYGFFGAGPAWPTYRQFGHGKVTPYTSYGAGGA